MGAAAGALGQLSAEAAAGAPARVRRFLDEKTAANPYYEIQPQRHRPNIFLITLDMVSPDFYLPSRRLYHDVHLPTIRSLAADGVQFLNAFCTTPLCAPSRGAYLTGRYPYILGNGERTLDGLDTELRPSDVIFPQYLNAAGYAAKQIGKCHVGTQTFINAFGENDNPWNRWSPPIDDDEIYLGYLRRLGVKRQRYSKEIVCLQQDRKTPGNSLGGWIEQLDRHPFPLEAQYTYYLVERALEKLYSAGADPNTSKHPLYLQLDIFDPHQPLSVPEGFEDREKALRAVIKLPESYEQVKASNWRPVASQPKIYDLYRNYWGLYNPQTLRDYLVGYALQMEVVDRSLAQFIGDLKRQGLYEEAVIILMSDHGEMSGRWAIIDKGVYLYPDVVRVPLIVKTPTSWGFKPRAVEAPVSLLDIAPTLLEIAGVEPEARLDGRSLLPHLQGSAGVEDRRLLFTTGWHVSVNFACGTQLWEPGRGHYLYSYNLSSRVDELYDLNSSDAENLASRASYRDVRHEMIRRLGRFLRNDPRWLAYWSGFRIDQYFDLPRVAGGQQMIEPR